MWGKKCLKCDSKNINTKKESFMAGLQRSSLNLAFPIRLLTTSGRKPKNLNVCRDCGFSWEDR